MERRSFLASLPVIGAVTRLGVGPAPWPQTQKRSAGPIFDISVSQWSFHRAIFGDSRSDYDWFIRTLHASPDEVLRGYMDPRDIVFRAAELGVSVVDLVNVLFFGHAQDNPWLDEFERRAKAAGVEFGVLMLDESGPLGASDPVERAKAIEAHRAWMQCARRLSCTSVRVNAYGDGTYLEQMEQCATSLRILGDLGLEWGLEVLVENHGHPSSNGAWLAMLMEKTNHANVGILADFDNFFMGGWGHTPQRRYDTRQGMLDIAPYTRALSAKSYAFLPDGTESSVDFEMCLRIMLESGFRGMASAEFEGEHLDETEGTAATVRLLRRLQEVLHADY